MPEIIVFIISLVAVIYGADWLGNAATNIAKSLSLPRVLIGATIVSIATTLPEFTIAALSASGGTPNLGIGTVHGSPVVNIGLIFGILLLFSKAQIEKAYFLRTAQFLFTAIVLVLLILLGGTISPVAAWSLIIAGVVYLTVEFIISKREQPFLERLETRFERLKHFFLDGKHYQQIFFLVVGALLLLLGAHFLIDSTVVLAGLLGVPQIVIGTLVVALGTSLPEAFTAIVSVVKKRGSLAVGNLFGASILDLTLGLGAGSAFGGIRIDSGSSYLTIGAIGVLSLISLFSIFGKISPKLIGAVLVGVYLVFIVWFALIEI